MLDATEAAIRVLEADPTFNAGYGANRNSDGQVELDASMMDGVTLDVGAITAVCGCGTQSAWRRNCCVSARCCSPPRALGDSRRNG